MGFAEVEAGFELTCDDSGETKGKILVFEFGIGMDAGKSVGKIKRYSIRNVASVDIGATKICAFDNGDAFFGLGEV